MFGVQLFCGERNWGILMIWRHDGPIGPTAEKSKINGKHPTHTHTHTVGSSEWWMKPIQLRRRSNYMHGKGSSLARTYFAHWSLLNGVRTASQCIYFVVGFFLLFSFRFSFIIAKATTTEQKFTPPTNSPTADDAREVPRLLFGWGLSLLFFKTDKKIIVALGLVAPYRAGWGPGVMVSSCS